MVVDELQALLSEAYALELCYDVRDFLLTDPILAAAIDHAGRANDEKLLIAEHDGEASVSLYLDPALLARLDRNNPTCYLSAENLEDFWTALEGVSHFLYYAWNAALEKSVTLLEMELQAEVDKFVGAAVLLSRQGRVQPQSLHRWLFDLPRFDDRLQQRELDRYRDASRYAGKYCLQLVQRIAGNVDRATLTNELRYFYRLPQAAKIHHIDAQ